jgi:hypothetical protein
LLLWRVREALRVLVCEMFCWWGEIIFELAYTDKTKEFHYDNSIHAYLEMCFECTYSLHHISISSFLCSFPFNFSWASLYCLHIYVCVCVYIYSPLQSSSPLSILSPPPPLIPHTHSPPYTYMSHFDCDERYFLWCLGSNRGDLLRPNPSG